MRRRLPTLRSGGEKLRERLEGQPVAHRPQSGDLAQANRRQQGALAEFFARMQVGQVDLDCG